MGSKAIFTATIADGATTSNAIDCREHEIVAMQFDASFDGATISFTACAHPDPSAPDAPGYDAVVDNAGNAVSITVTDDRYVVFDEEPMRNLAGLAWFKIVSASTESGAQTVRIVAKRIL